MLAAKSGGEISVHNGRILRDTLPARIESKFNDKHLDIRSLIGILIGDLRINVSVPGNAKKKHTTILACKSDHANAGSETVNLERMAAHLDKKTMISVKFRLGPAVCQKCKSDGEILFELARMRLGNNMLTYDPKTGLVQLRRKRHSRDAQASSMPVAQTNPPSAKPHLSPQNRSAPLPQSTPLPQPPSPTGKPVNEQNPDSVRPNPKPGEENVVPPSDQKSVATPPPPPPPSSDNVPRPYGGGPPPPPPPTTPSSKSPPSSNVQEDTMTLIREGVKLRKLPQSEKPPNDAGKSDLEKKLADIRADVAGDDDDGDDDDDYLDAWAANGGGIEHIDAEWIDDDETEEQDVLTYGGMRLIGLDGEYLTLDKLLPNGKIKESDLSQKTLDELRKNPDAYEKLVDYRNHPTNLPGVSKWTPPAKPAPKPVSTPSAPVPAKPTAPIVQPVSNPVPSPQQPVDLAPAPPPPPPPPPPPSSPAPKTNGSQPAAAPKPSAVATGAAPNHLALIKAGNVKLRKVDPNVPNPAQKPAAPAAPATKKAEELTEAEMLQRAAVARGGESSSVLAASATTLKPTTPLGERLAAARMFDFGNAIIDVNNDDVEAYGEIVDLLIGMADNGQTQLTEDDLTNDMTLATLLTEHRGAGVENNQLLERINNALKDPGMDGRMLAKAIFDEEEW
jgi:hypothetical protein